MNSIALRGCTPEPLGNYLKALGVFRLVAEQKDSRARGLWRNGVFNLISSLDGAALVQFLLNKYAPTPIFAPWAGRSAFDSKGNKDAFQRLQRLSKSHDLRFKSAQETVKQIGNVSRKTKGIDAALVEDGRRRWSHSALRWLDAAIVIEEEPTFGFLLGIGGVEGSANLTNNFWEMVELAMGFGGKKNKKMESWLWNALFDEAAMGGIGTTAGQHFPIATEAPNHGQSFTGQALTNPWDFILMMEGCLVFAGAATKRLSTTGKRKAAFPFMLDGLAVGSGTLSPGDESKCRAEFWMPAWESPILFVELRAMIAEGRVQRSDAQPAIDSTEAIEAVAVLGVDRGIKSFRRTGLYERRGKGYYIASFLGDYTVPPHPSRLPHLLTDVKEFRRRLRFVKGESPRLARAAIQVEDAIFSALRADTQSPRDLSTDHLYRVLNSIHLCEAELATLPRLHGRIRPQSPLKESWRLASGGYPGLDDQSVEFHLAAAIASLTPWDWPEEGRWRGEGPNVDSARPYLLPVVREGTRWNWTKNGRSPSAVWSGSDLSRDLAAVLRRRLIDASRSEEEGLPLSGIKPASFRDLLRFWRGEIDEARMESLIHALALLDWTEGGSAADGTTPDLSPTAFWTDETGRVHTRWNAISAHLRPEVEAAAALPRAYSLLKLCFLGGRLPPRPVEGRTVKPTGEEPYPPRAPEILSLLLAYRLPEALAVAARKLRATGYPAIVPEGALRSGEMAMTGEECRRLAAMLLFPIHSPGILSAMVIRPRPSFTGGGSQ
ncbi:MAG: type I-U CRISPR-associated protein Csx17 [Halobacteria archaeon]